MGHYQAAAAGPSSSQLSILLILTVSSSERPLELRSTRCSSLTLVLEASVTSVWHASYGTLDNMHSNAMSGRAPQAFEVDIAGTVGEALWNILIGDLSRSLSLSEQLHQESEPIRHHEGEKMPTYISNSNSSCDHSLNLVEKSPTKRNKHDSAIASTPEARKTVLSISEQQSQFNSANTSMNTNNFSSNFDSPYLDSIRDFECCISRAYFMDSIVTAIKKSSVTSESAGSLLQLEVAGSSGSGKSSLLRKLVLSSHGFLFYFFIPNFTAVVYRLCLCKHKKLKEM